MATIDEILASMPEPTAEGDHEYLTIDPATRSIHVPESEKIFGVTGDELADRKYFICPRIVGDGLDLASMFIRVNFRNADGEEDGYLVNDVTVAGDYVTFSWQLWPKVAAYQGEVLFSVCADLPNTPDRRMPDWSTTLASGEVLEGLRPDDGYVADETSDVVTQLRAETAAQTVAVEATGAAQVQTVEAAGATATADAKAQIEAKGEAVRASIPADYSTLAGKANEFANAIKGHLSGQIVQAGDVSPVEHFLGVKVRGKNLFDTSKIPTATPSVSYAYVSEVGVGRIVVRTEEGYDGNGYCTVAKTLREVCPSLEVGKTYVLTASTESNSTNMYLPGVQKSWIFGQAMVMTEAVLNSVMTFYGLSAREGMGTGDCTISNIQIEEGTEATEYTPYIDPAGVTVTRCGKNLFSRAASTKNLDDCRAWGQRILGAAATKAIFKPGQSYAVSFEVEGLDNLPYAELFAADVGFSLYSPSEWHPMLKLCLRTSTKDTDWLTAGKKIAHSSVFTIPDNFADTGAAYELFVYTQRAFDSTGAAFLNRLKFNYIQIEKGDAATAYEPYKGATAMPDESGAVAGLPSLAPAMTLLTDTAGVNIECAYNRDTNAVLAEILERIAALSG